MGQTRPDPRRQGSGDTICSETHSCAHRPWGDGHWMRSCSVKIPLCPGERWEGLISVHTLTHTCTDRRGAVYAFPLCETSLRSAEALHIRTSVGKRWLIFDLLVCIRTSWQGSLKVTWCYKSVVQSYQLFNNVLKTLAQKHYLYIIQGIFFLKPFIRTLFKSYFLFRERSNVSFL